MHEECMIVWSERMQNSIKCHIKNHDHWHSESSTTLNDRSSNQTREEKNLKQNKTKCDTNRIICTNKRIKKNDKQQQKQPQTKVIHTVEYNGKFSI